MSITKPLLLRRSWTFREADEVYAQIKVSHQLYSTSIGDGQKLVLQSQPSTNLRSVKEVTEARKDNFFGGICQNSVHFTLHLPLLCNGKVEGYSLLTSCQVKDALREPLVDLSLYLFRVCRGYGSDARPIIEKISRQEAG